MTVLRLEAWLPIYREVCADFGFDQRKDLESAKLLAGILGKRSTAALESVKRTVPKTVLLCGGSPGLADELSLLRVDGYVVCADGATTVVNDAGIGIDMVVTDLDGIVEDQIEVNSHGAAVFVHAHGDNMKAIRDYANRFNGATIGTCQCPPPENLFNFGGFTDGDRAACICAELGAKTVVLAGFDFENPSCKQGKTRDVKLRKLRWAKHILNLLSKEGVRFVPARDSEFMA